MESGGKSRKVVVKQLAKRFTLHVPRWATGRQPGAGWHSPLSQILHEHAVCNSELRDVFLCTNLVPSNKNALLKFSVFLCRNMNNFSISVPYTQPRVSDLSCQSKKVSRKLIWQKKAIFEALEGNFYMAGSPWGLTFSSLLGL